MTVFTSNLLVWGALGAALLVVGAYAFRRPHHSDSTPPKNRH